MQSNYLSAINWIEFAILKIQDGAGRHIETRKSAVIAEERHRSSCKYISKCLLAVFERREYVEFLDKKT